MADLFSIKIRMTPDDETLNVILAILNLWQDVHPDKMIAMVPAKEKYVYEIIDRIDRKRIFGEEEHNENNRG